MAALDVNGRRRNATGPPFGASFVRAVPRVDVRHPENRNIHSVMTPPLAHLRAEDE
jgi:hypothetical protein